MSGILLSWLLNVRLLKIGSIEFHILFLRIQLFFVLIRNNQWSSDNFPLTSLVISLVASLTHSLIVTLSRNVTHHHAQPRAHSSTE